MVPVKLMSWGTLVFVSHKVMVNSENGVKTPLFEEGSEFLALLQEERASLLKTFSNSGTIGCK